ncbi:uncharacterized protein (TIGR02246 family) [Herbihabitans rhizosphaerae]|uniref:Uncharacterized protein (TIGR02246 family) n=1 Tax=Herbihabitans rhizosphaerae TaxID=1872711 RepID=A0A4Q7L4P6_9PSEU|nr:SgcJ/EcaC family oxidoreductase [Herbihabitans rhizosphaerae]RZS43481.1 uncharacterized protein (TIGR02246 family) [Herbihabitans rhizosphaerae]
MSDEQRIRDLIERWTSAVHTGDMAGVLADHAEDIVMFDVPPPHDGVRGIDDYRATWPGFFEWQAAGASFEIVELDVTAGEDVAFAHALLRCGTPEELTAIPQQRLRLTLGLRKENGRWVVAHEHHSFADLSADFAVAEREVRAVHEDWSRTTADKDLDGLMSHIADDVVSYEHGGPLAYVGVDDVREVCARGLDSGPGVDFDTPDLTVLVRDDLAVSWGFDRVRVHDGESVTTWSRGTRVFQRRDGRWLMIHQHLSYPMGESGQVRTDLTP